MEVALTIVEKNELEECKAIVSRGMKIFYEVGCALAKIRDKKLYRETHKTFEQFCRDEWNLSRTTAFYQIKASEVVDDLKNVHHGEQIPESERVVRPLISLDSDTRREVWNTVIDNLSDGEKPTARLVQKAVNIHCPKKSKVDSFTEVKSTEPRLDELNARIKCISEQHKDDLLSGKIEEVIFPRGKQVTANEYLQSKMLDDLETDRRRELYDHKEEIKRLREINQRLVREVDELRRALHKENILAPECASHAPCIYIVD